MTDDELVAALREDISKRIKAIDVSMQTDFVEQLSQYKELYHNKIMFNESSEPVAITRIETIDGMIKVRLQPIGSGKLINPLPLNSEVGDGSYCFLPSFPDE